MMNKKFERQRHRQPQRLRLKEGEGPHHRDLLEEVDHHPRRWQYPTTRETKKRRCHPKTGNILTSLLLVTIYLLLILLLDATVVVEGNLFDGVFRVGRRRRGAGCCPCRTTLFFHGKKPTEDDIRHLFDTDPLSLDYNHECAGMTNPSIHSCGGSSNGGIGMDRIGPIVQDGGEGDDNVDEDATGGEGTTTGVSSSSSVVRRRQQQQASTVSLVEDSPSCSSCGECTGFDDDTRRRRRRRPWLSDAFSSSPQPQQEWRKISIRRVVGRGETCYQTLRDVVLSWEDLHRDSDWAGIRLFNIHPHHQHQKKNNNHHHPMRKRRSKNKMAGGSVMRRGGGGSVLMHDDDDDSGNSNGNNVQVNQFASSDVPPSVMQIGPNKKLVTMSKIPLLFGKKHVWTIINPCQVVYDCVDERFDCGGGNSDGGGGGMTYTSTAYGTLEGHLLRGEERVSVALHDRSSTDGRGGEVEVEVLSYSKPSSGLLGRLVFPFVKDMQTRFFMEEVDTLERIAKEVMMARRRTTGGESEEEGEVSSSSTMMLGGETTGSMEQGTSDQGGGGRRRRRGQQQPQQQEQRRIPPYSPPPRHVVQRNENGRRGRILVDDDDEEFWDQFQFPPSPATTARGSNADGDSSSINAMKYARRKMAGMLPRRLFLRPSSLFSTHSKQ